jgi:hypothetical protein
MQSEWMAWLIASKYICKAIITPGKEFIVLVLQQSKFVMSVPHPDSENE